MARPQFTDEDDALLSELGVEVEDRKVSNYSAREERIIVGFEDIELFFEQNGRLPVNGEDRDIFERLYAVRLDKIRTSEECLAVLAHFDKHGLLNGQFEGLQNPNNDLDDNALLAELGVLNETENDITKLRHVKTRAEIRAAEEIAKRVQSLEFDKFKPLFLSVQEDLKTGVRQSHRFKRDIGIEEGEFFILGGQIVYVAEVGEKIKTPNGLTDARMRVIYDNGTESDLLMRSLQRALYKDEAGRRIVDSNSPAPLFSDLADEDDIETGKIYVLRSKSDHPLIQEHREVIHKIGVTSGDVSKRIANAKLDPSFLMADVEVVATYELSNINRVKLESLLHKFFESARLNIEIKDRFGIPIVPREWFLVPRFVIDEAMAKIIDGSITKFEYDVQVQKIVERT